jgi:hypothetical protein
MIFKLMVTGWSPGVPRRVIKCLVTYCTTNSPYQQQWIPCRCKFGMEKNVFPFPSSRLKWMSSFTLLSSLPLGKILLVSTGKEARLAARLLWQSSKFPASLFFQFLARHPSRSCIIIIIIIIIIIMTLQPFVGPWPPLHFIDPIHSR